MIENFLDKGTYDILEFKLDVDYRGRSLIRLIGVGKSQEKDVEFEIKIRPSVIHGWPALKDVDEPEPEPEKRGPGRPRKIEADE